MIESFDRRTVVQMRAILSMGYIEPGHGYKRKQQWLRSDHDMYAIIMFWQEGNPNVMLLPAKHPINLVVPLPSVQRLSKAIANYLGGPRSYY